MNPTGHVLVRVNHLAASYTAYCLCGFHTVSYSKAHAMANLYSHTIHANMPKCPTPHKKVYPNQVHAENAIARFVKRTIPGARPARAYKCPSGQHWHTTKSTARERNAA